MSARTRCAAAILLALVLGACTGGRDAAPEAAAAGSPASYGLGRPATPEEIAAWDIDVNPTGASLPAGRGTWTDGARVFAAKCAACHGAHGEGMHPAYPALVGREPRDFSFADDVHKVKTVGNYWPYATTLYDYIHRAMPQTQPGSLTPDELYAVVAYLLAENGIVAKDFMIDRTTLPQVRMPGRDHFVPDDRRGGPGFK